MKVFLLAFIIDILPEVKFDNTIMLGTTLHALVLCIMIFICHGQAMRVLRRIEDKQDKIIQESVKENKHDAL